MTPTCRECYVEPDNVQEFMDIAQAHNADPMNDLGITPTTVCFSGNYYDPSTQTFLCPSCQKKRLDAGQEDMYMVPGTISRTVTKVYDISNDYDIEVERVDYLETEEVLAYVPTGSPYRQQVLDVLVVLAEELKDGADHPKTQDDDKDFPKRPTDFDPGS